MKTIFCEDGVQFFDEWRYYKDNGFRMTEISIDAFGDFECRGFRDDEQILIVKCDSKENEGYYIE